MSYPIIIILLLLAITPFSLSGVPARWVRSTESAGRGLKKKETHTFLVDNSFKRASPLRVKCSYWGEVVEDKTLAYEVQARWSSQISSPDKAVHCTCAVRFPPKHSGEFHTTEFDAIASKRLMKGVYRDEHDTYVSYLWRWYLKEDGIFYFDYEDHQERFVKRYKVRGN